MNGTCDINNPYGLLFIFSKVLLFFRSWEINSSNAIIGSERVLKMGEKILYNLQKNIVESTISTAAGLEKESSYPAARRALPYYLHFI
jgi:hypothetical protein